MIDERSTISDIEDASPATLLYAAHNEPRDGDVSWRSQRHSFADVSSGPQRAASSLDSNIAAAGASAASATETPRHKPSHGSSIKPIHHLLTSTGKGRHQRVAATGGPQAIPASSRQNGCVGEGTIPQRSQQCGDPDRPCCKAGCETAADVSHASDSRRIDRIPLQSGGGRIAMPDAHGTRPPRSPDAQHGTRSTSIQQNAGQAAAQPSPPPMEADGSAHRLNQQVADAVRTLRYTRYLVLDVEEGSPGGPATLQLRVYDESACAEATINLRDDWAQTRVSAGDIVNVIFTDPADRNGRAANGGGGGGGGGAIVVDDTRNLLVLQPDCLVTCTQVVDGHHCKRKAILSSRYVSEADEGDGEAQLRGKLLHSIFEFAMMNPNASAEDMERAERDCVRCAADQLYSAGLTDEWAMGVIAEGIPNIQNCVARFVRSTPAPHANARRSDGKDASVYIAQAVSVEMMLWSPVYGLYGKVDVIVKAALDEVPRPNGDDARNIAIVPLELKTGKFSGLESSQLAIYMLLVAERFRGAVPFGLLYNMAEDTMLVWPPSAMRERGILRLRNDIVQYISDSSRLPPVIRNPSGACMRCRKRSECMALHRLAEGGTAESSALGAAEFARLTGHLSDAHAAYLRQWSHLLSLESTDAQRMQQGAWSLPSLERQYRGQSYANMELVQQEEVITPDRLLTRFRCRFRAAPMEPAAPPHGDLPTGTGAHEMGMEPGDQVIVVAEKSHCVVAAGTLLRVMPQNEVLLELGQCVEPEAPLLTTSSCVTVREPQLYRIDNNSQANMKAAHSNVLALFALRRNDDQDNVLRPFDRLRRLIVDLEQPRFREPGMLNVHEVMTDEAMENLNVDQVAAMRLVACAEDYALILGMPGTGKTTTVARIVEAWVRAGRSVLITAYTHAAVDNILRKLHERGVGFLRLGPPARVHPQIQPYTMDQRLLAEGRTVAAIERIFQSVRVVATTCLGSSHNALLRRLSFDLCIVDEASQVTEAVCLGPLRYANVFLLVGDHYQLPPLVRCATARDGGMDVSLFRRLSERHPAAVALLEHQYRMCRDIMHLANRLIYAHHLRCGNAAVANARLSLPRYAAVLDRLRGTGCAWIAEALDPERCAVVLDTDRRVTTEAHIGLGVQNQQEAGLVNELIRALDEAGCSADGIGIVSPYRAQIRSIRDTVQMSGVEIDTVDKFQGRDKDCIVLSLVRSNEAHGVRVDPRRLRAHRNAAPTDGLAEQVGGLLRDWRRVNVAITRAKMKLLVLGSRRTLSVLSLFQQLFEMAERSGWLIAIPPASR